MHDAGKADGWQQVFNGAETIQDALHSQAGCEAALRLVLDPILAGRGGDDQIVWALVDSMAHWREKATAEIRQVQQVSFG